MESLVPEMSILLLHPVNQHKKTTTGATGYNTFFPKSNLNLNLTNSQDFVNCEWVYHNLEVLWILLEQTLQFKLAVKILAMF